MPFKFAEKKYIHRNADTLIVDIVKDLREIDDVQQSRLGDYTKEILGASSVLTDARNVWQTNKGRKYNFIHAIAETVWMLSGNKDLDFLEKFLPQCRAFSDDGLHWRSCYGPRIRNWVGRNDNNYCRKGEPEEMVLDQWKNAIEELQTRPDSRQAIVQIWDPCVCGDFRGREKVLDRACNRSVDFKLRDNKLSIFIENRSNDVYWGLSSINLVEFSIMLQLTASVLGCELGHQQHDSRSLHVYNRHFDKIEELLTDKELLEDFSISNTEGDSCNFEKLPNFATLSDILDLTYKNIEHATKNPGRKHLLEPNDLLEGRREDKLSEYAKLYPNIVYTLNIPVLKYVEEDSLRGEVFGLMNRNLHPALKILLERKYLKVDAVIIGG